ncbi:MAG: hypothetical protein H6747_04725 [Deltaproteobacteria bacterium]|nr:hypothetical protein [Deltaproteobacteria bacterium]
MGRGVVLLLLAAVLGCGGGGGGARDGGTGDSGGWVGDSGGGGGGGGGGNSGGDSDSVSGGDSDGGGGLDAFPGPEWQSLGAVAIDGGGHSLPLAVTVSAADRLLALRIRPTEAEPAAPWCFGIDDVRLPDGSVWLQPQNGGLGASTQPFGSQRALPQHGYGVFVLPNDGVSALPDGPVTFRVVLRDCRYDLPTKRVPGADFRGRYGALPKAVQVEYAREPAVADDAPMQLRLRVAVGSGSGYPSDLAADPDWQAALARAQQLFATAGVALQVERIVSVTLQKELHYGPGQRTAIDAAWEAAMAKLVDDPSERSRRFVPVVLVGCLVRDAPLATGPQSFAGQTTRIPGGAPFGSSASGVFLAYQSCTGGGSPLVGEAMGSVLAHELGHHLGLLHSSTSLGAHRAREGYADIMRATADLAGSAGFTKAQRAALRRHFDVMPAP